VQGEKITVRGVNLCFDMKDFERLKAEKNQAVKQKQEALRQFHSTNKFPSDKTLSQLNSAIKH